MYKEYPYLIDGYYQTLNSQSTKKEFLKKIDELVVNHQYVKITLLDVDENPIKDITGEITGGSLSINGSSSARRTGSLSCSVTTDVEALENDEFSTLSPVEKLKQYFSIDKKIYLELGVRNDIDIKPWGAKDYPILWFPQGVFFITNFDISSSTSTAVSMSISLTDKMSKLNGFSGGYFPSQTRLDTYYDYGEANALAESMSKKSKVKASSDYYVMNVKEIDGRKTSDISWTKTSTVSWIAENYAAITKSTDGTASLKGTFTIASNKYLQFAYYCNGIVTDSLDMKIMNKDGAVIQESIADPVEDDMKTVEDYADLDYKQLVYYLRPGTYTLEFSYEQKDEEAETSAERFAMVHMLNSDQEGGVTFIQEHNGKNPIYNIISEVVNHFGGEDLDKIIIEDVPLYGKTAIRWDVLDSSEDEEAENLYMISNIRNDDPILSMGNRIMSMSNDDGATIPGTNYERKYTVEDDNSLTEYDKQPEESADNLMLVTDSDMRRITLSKWAQDLVKTGRRVNCQIADIENWDTIEGLNSTYRQYKYEYEDDYDQIRDYLAYISNNGLLGSKSKIISSFSNLATQLDLNEAFVGCNGSISNVFPDLSHDGRTWYVDKNGYLFTIDGAANAVYFHEFEDDEYSLDAQYSIEKYEFGDDIGYARSYLYYDGELTASTKETVVSILDKIVSKLGGNYEYYYDVFGKFHFREKKNYINKSFSTAMVNDTETANRFLQDSGIYYLTDTYQSESVYSFNDKDNIMSLTNNPNYSNIKNDFIVNNNDSADLKYYHIAIDEKPEINDEGYSNVLVYQTPVEMNDISARINQYDLAFPIFIDSPEGPQGAGSSDIYGYINSNDSVTIKLNEVNLNKDYSTKINIESQPKEDGKEPTDDGDLDDSEDGSSNFSRAEDFYYALTFLQILFTTGGDSVHHKYSSYDDIDRNTIGALLYYLYNVTDNGKEIKHLYHSKTKKQIITNKKKNTSKTIYKNDTAYEKLDDLKYDSTLLASIVPDAYSETRTTFNSSTSKRFTGWKSSYTALGKNASQRKSKAESLINKVLSDNYLFNGIDGETMVWHSSNAAATETSFIKLYNSLMSALGVAYGYAETVLDKKANGKNNKTDKFYTDNVEKYITGSITKTKWFGSSDPKVRDKKKKAFKQKKKKARKKSGKKTPTNKRINQLAEQYVKKHTKTIPIPRFKDRKKKSYSAFIKALYNTLVKLYKLKSAKGTKNMVLLDDKYYYTNKNASAQKKNSKLINQLLNCFWKQSGTKITSKTKKKNKKFKEFLNKHKGSAYKYLTNFYDSKMSVLSQTITLERHEVKYIDQINDKSAEAVIEKAREHIGCCRNGKGRVPDVKSHKSTYIDSWAYEPWCAEFVYHVFKECGLSNKVNVSNKAAVESYSHLSGYHKGTKYKPKKGDLILFNWGNGGDAYDHIGIVIQDLGGGNVKTIEGNTLTSKVAVRTRSKSNVQGFVEMNLITRKQIQTYKKKSTTVTYSLFSLFRKVFYNELNNEVYNYKKPIRCDFLRHKMRQYFEILYTKHYCADKKNIYQKCAETGMYNESQKVSTVNDAPEITKDSSLTITDKGKESESINLDIQYISGTTWREWVSSSYNPQGIAFIDTISQQEGLKNSYVFIKPDGGNLYWLGDGKGSIINCEDYISSNVTYKWYKTADGWPKQEASLTSGVTAPQLTYNTYNCMYKNVETVKFWYYDKVSEQWTELEDWVCYYNDDIGKRYVNIDFAAVDTDVYSGLRTPKYLPNLNFMKENAIWTEANNRYTYTFTSSMRPSMRINSQWYKDESGSSMSPLNLDGYEYNVNSTDSRLNLSRYTAKEWRTEIILQGLLSYEQNSIEASYYYPELKALWPTTYNFKDQCFYGQEEDSMLYHTSLTSGNYFLDLVDPNDTQMGDLSVRNIGRRQNITSNKSINCLFAPEPHEYYFLNASAIDYFEQRNKLIEEGLTFITISPQLWDQYFKVGYTKVSAYDAIRSDFTTYTNYKNTISISSLPVLYLEPNIRVNVDDDTTDTHGHYIIDSFNINFSGTPSMSTSCTRAVKKY